ncbi:MAG: glycosyltransferase [Thermoflexus sp.]|uniref:glycosyltransferase n=1 Tax=Thermoflexus sp. TaxID=1969742 RepID=UPI0025E06090|nr:glycosyltransferase [Thermoflexus sp.]MCS6964654.1 glycosyltransferase [Thermoflexus sp.]
MNILMALPYPPSRIRIRPFGFLQALARRGHRIRVLAVQPPEDRDADLAPMRRLGVEIHCFPLSRGRTLWNAGWAWIRGGPLQAGYADHPGLREALRQSLREPWDAVHIEHLRGAGFAREIPADRLVFDAVDSITRLFEQARAMAPGRLTRWLARLELARTRQLEAGWLSTFPRIVVTSEEDAAALRRLAPNGQASFTVIPNGVDLEFFQPWAVPRDPATLIFTGKMSYHANVAAALDLIGEIMPRIWARRPEVRLWIVGRNPPSRLRRAARDPRVEILGTVPDLRPYLARATLAVCPLRYAVGIQNKVLEAMAMGTPVVATPPVLGGLRAIPGQDLVVAEGPEAFAEAVLRLLDAPAQRSAMGAAGRAYVEQHHRWEALVERLEEVYAASPVSGGSSG